MANSAEVRGGAARAGDEWTPLPLKARLYVMMFLQYFVQGCYLPIATQYVKEGLKFSDREAGIFNGALSIGPLLAPFLLGQLVDRHFATQKVLAVGHFIAGGLMLLLYTQHAAWPVIVLGAIYSVLYVPSMMMTNSLAFWHLRQEAREFPAVRLWGTIGFIIPAWLIELTWLSGLTGEQLNQARGVCFAISGVAGLVLGLYCLTLPNTPPTRGAGDRFAPGTVLKLLTHRNFLVLVLVSLGIATVHQYHFAWNSMFIKEVLRTGGYEGAIEQRLSSLGQIAEIFVMLALGPALVRFGFKPVMLVGAVAYMTRCLIFAAAAGMPDQFSVAIGLVGLGQALHGFCFGCFLAAAYIYVDRVAPPDVRGSMQTFYGTFIVGAGFVLGGLAQGVVGPRFSTGPEGAEIRDWQAIWLCGAALATVCVAALAALFPRDNAGVTARAE